MARCLIGCGSNQGARREQLDRAVELLGVMPGIRLTAVSRHRETRPVGGPPDQPPFLNGVCLLDTDLSPHELLGLLTAVENTLHRDRSERWGPRTVDLDLLLYDDVVIDDEAVAGAALTVPHPRMTTRRFVLEPAVEIAPELRHPLAGCSLRDLLDNISQPALRVCVVGIPGAGADTIAAGIADATLARLVPAGAALPEGRRARDPAAWRDVLEACAAPLSRETWADDPHGSVADQWLGSLLVAAGMALPPADLAVFAADHAAAMAATVPPHVAIVLRLSGAALERRAAETRGKGARGTDPERLQDGLLARLRCRTPGQAPPAPPSVVVVDADDPRRALDEAIAAVEAAA